jgi:hypothetical protein
VCVGEDRVPCQAKGKGAKLFICHYDTKQNIYKTMCLPESGVPGHLMNHDKDYCGECIEQVLIRFIEFLDSKDNASDALSTVNPEDMKKIVEEVKNYVSDGVLKDLITPESIIEAYYPHDSVLDLKYILSPEKIMSTYYPELYEDIMNDADSSQQNRSLEVGSLVSTETISDPSSLLPSISVPEGCWPALIGWIVALIGVILALLPLVASPLLQTAIGTTFESLSKLRFGAQTAVLDQFMDWFDAAMMVSGKPLTVLWAWVQAIWNLSTVMGVKVLFQGIKDAVMSTKPSLEDYLYITASLLLQIIAWSVTGWAAFIFQAALLAVQIRVFTLACTNFNEKCHILDSICKPEDLNCDDGNKCTINTGICESGAWQCTVTDVTCSAGLSCDPFDGMCKSDDQLIPCVAVIDEDDSFGIPNQASRWEEFRTRYPSRPFCLLVPNPEGRVNIPPNFLADELTIVYFNIPRDYGAQAAADDWAVKCGLDLYHPAQVGYVGLFVDDSGSMRKTEVIASYNKFINFMTTKNIQVKEVVNSNENWILPFLTTLVPPLGCVSNDGRVGTCVDSSDCTSYGKIPLPWQQGDPEPNCFNYPNEIQCCVDGEACVTRDGREGKCMDSGACTSYGKTPVPWQPGDPTPNCAKYSNSIQCCVLPGLFVRRHIQEVSIEEHGDTEIEEDKSVG